MDVMKNLKLDAAAAASGQLSEQPDSESRALVTIATSGGAYSRERFKRIVACVNACAGVESALLTPGFVGELRRMGSEAVQRSLDRAMELSKTRGDLELAKDLGKLAATAAETGIEAMQEQAQATRLELDMAQDRITALEDALRRVLPVLDSWGAAAAADSLEGGAQAVEQARALVAGSDDIPEDERPVVLVLGRPHANALFNCLEFDLSDLSTVNMAEGEDGFDDYKRVQDVRDALAARGVNGGV